MFKWLDVESNFTVYETRWRLWHGSRGIGYDMRFHNVVINLMHDHRFSKSLRISKDSIESSVSMMAMDEYHYATVRNLSYWMWVSYV